MNSNDNLQVENTYRNIIRLALPISVAIFIPQISMFVNTLFLGYYTPANQSVPSAHLLAASGIAGIFYLTLVMFGYGLVSGLLMLMSRKAGSNDRKGLENLFLQGGRLCFAFALMLLTLSFVLAPTLFQHFIHNPEVQQPAIAFIQIRVWSLPVIILSQLINSYFIATSQAKYIMIGSSMQALSNILLDYLLIFGIGGLPEMGLAGAAWASVLSDYIFFFTALLVFYRTKPTTFKMRGATQWSLQKNILITSSPLMVQYLLSIGAWEVFFLFVEHLGKEESAVSQILRSVFGIVGVAAWALASTSNSMVSNLIGQQKHAEVIPAIQKIVRVSLGFALVVGLPLALFPKFFLSLMTSQPQLIEVGYASLRIVVFATWMLSVSTIYFNGVVGTGNTKINMLFELAAIVFYLIYCTVVIEYHRMPLPWAWGSEFVYWLVLFGLSAFYLHRKFGRFSSSTKR
jgi:MATE family multidrug resistance protein